MADEDEPAPAWPLSDDASAYVFESLDPHDLAAAAGVCRRWRTVGRADTLWWPLFATLPGVGSVQEERGSPSSGAAAVPAHLLFAALTLACERRISERCLSDLEDDEVRLRLAVEECSGEVRRELKTLDGARRQVSAAEAIRDGLLARHAHASMQAATPRPLWAHPGNRPPSPPPASELRAAEKRMAAYRRMLPLCDRAIADAKLRVKLGIDRHRQCVLRCRGARAARESVEAMLCLHPAGASAAAVLARGQRVWRGGAAGVRPTADVRGAA